MKDEKIRQAIDQYSLDNDVEIKILDNPSFDKSIIGIDSSHRLVYDYEKMVEELASDDNMLTEDAEDFISYSTLRAIPYWDNPPIVLNMKTEQLLEQI